MAKYNWTRQETKDLITLYEVNDCLWNKGLREYKDRDERVSSIQSIADEMRISIEEINKKIHNLRNQYRFELNKSKKKIPGKPQYVSKWPYYNNLNFLENIVSVRGAHPQNNNNTNINNNQNDDDGTNEAKYEETFDENNFSDKFNNNDSLAALQNVSIPAVITVEYEDIKPVILKTETPISQANTRKRKLPKNDVPQVVESARMSPQQQQFMNYVTHQIQMQQVASSSPKTIPTIAVDDNRQMVQNLHQNGVVIDVEEPKNNSNVDDDEPKTKIFKDDGKQDGFEIFGLFVANELRGLTSVALMKKLKRKILELVLNVTDEDSKNGK